MRTETMAEVIRDLLTKTSSNSHEVPLVNEDIRTVPSLQRECLLSKSEVPLPKLAFEHVKADHDWQETNMGLDELTHGSHVLNQKHAQYPDSLNNVAPEEQFYDSIGDKPRKVIIPSSISFNDSFSSDTSLFHTSLDVSIDSIGTLANPNQDSLENHPEPDQQDASRAEPQPPNLVRLATERMKRKFLGWS